MTEALRDKTLAMLGEDPDHMIAEGESLEWLRAQLACWPERVDENRTTNLRFLRLSAAATLGALADNPPSPGPKTRLRELEAYVRSGLPDLTNRQMAIVMLAVLEGPQTVRGVARRLLIQKAVVTRAVTALVSLGFVTRVPDPGDGRSHFITATDAGREFVGRLTQ